MAIPKIDLPTYKLHLKSSDIEVEFRPFVVKEEKILLLALESDDFNNILSAAKQIIKNCIITEIDVDSLPLFEIEFIFLNLRARSIGEMVELTYICQNTVEDKKCKNEMVVQIDLLKAALDMEVQNPTLRISDKVGIKLKYPTIEATKLLNGDKPEIEVAVQLIKECTEYLFDENQIYKPEDMEPGEFEQFIENLTQDQFIMIKKFFDDIPTLTHDINANCGRCGKNHSIHLEGLLDFFE